MSRLNLFSMIGTTLRNRTAHSIALGLGTLASALIFASGIIWYPLMEVVVFAPLPLLFVVIGGIWLGAIWPAQVALWVGNAAVIAGFAGVLTLYWRPPSQSNPIFFFGSALMLALGYALVAGILAGGLVALGRST